MKDDLSLKIESLQEKGKLFSVLYVEDEKLLRDSIVQFLSKFFLHVDTAVDGFEGFEKYKKKKYDIVITDILMPNMNGIELIKGIKEENKDQEIIVISAHTDSSYFIEAIELAVTGYIMKPVNFNQILNVLNQSINKLTAFRENELYKNQLELMVEERTKKVFELKEELINNYQNVIYSFVKLIERRDAYTGGHSERVAMYSKKIAEKMGLSEKECELIYKAGILHDIGKIVTPDSILLKPGKLTKQEYSLIQEHVEVGYEILKESPMYKDISKVVYAHHERCDGSGYPNGLKAKEIPLLSKIMAVADTFDAMTSNRIYKKRNTVQKALEELKKLSNISYDKKIVQSAIEVLKNIDITNYIDQEPVSVIDDEHFAYFYKDPLTLLYNSEYFDFSMEKNSDSNNNFQCLTILYLKNFTPYNKKYGWNQGNKFLKEFASYLLDEFSEFRIFRIFGDDFALLHRVHANIDVDKINSIALLQRSGIYCKLKHISLIDTHISTYEELQEEEQG
ncbi:HD domain-containing phosphohydrolase [Sulfurospirillum arcachonense]|uniref:HD domain-containing phosphohydrolase n=1 Tax=Sulfurospirillum arcachonense TaxID=57666 RepID=UPI0004686A09|nr:HD domain-containing phosphohydrolase [Sulfurospirillum arcachonense]